MVLFLHNRYRTTGGEERVVKDLLWLVREHLGESAQLLQRDSATLGRTRAAIGLLGGGLQPQEVAQAVRQTGARVVHAHNLHPALGWRALAAARSAGARVVLHLHQYRLVCAIGVCFTRGQQCTRCHARNTLPGVLLNCRGSLAESVTYATSLALWQQRLLDQADAVIVPSVFAREMLRELGAPLPFERVHVLAPPVREMVSVSSAKAQSYALLVSRLAQEKGVDVAIAACRAASVELVVAGDGPQRAQLEKQAEQSSVRFAGHVPEPELSKLRAKAAIALVPSRSAETFGMSAAEAMAAGLPVAASRIGALPELLADKCLVPAGDVNALAKAIECLRGDRQVAEQGLRQVRAMCAPGTVAARLAEIYDGGPNT